MAVGSRASEEAKEWARRGEEVVKGMARGLKEVEEWAKSVGKAWYGV